MRKPLYLFAGRSDETHCTINLAHDARHFSRTFEGIDEVANADMLYGLARTISHPHERTGADTLEIEIHALLLLLVPRVVQPEELDVAIDAVRRLERPARGLLRVAVARPEHLLKLLNELLGLVLLRPNDRAARVERGHPGPEIALPATGRTAVADNVRGVVDDHLLPWRRHENRLRGELAEPGPKLVELFLREVLPSLLERLDRRRFSHAQMLKARIMPANPSATIPQMPWWNIFSLMSCQRMSSSVRLLRMTASSPETQFTAQ
jgi:hypothetical protein